MVVVNQGVATAAAAIDAFSLAENACRSILISADVYDVGEVHKFQWAPRGDVGTGDENPGVERARDSAC